MYGLGYVQRFGAGIPLIRNSLAMNQNPEPHFDAADTYVAVTIWRRP
jgi:ATP-dependent DNA helicase RecG